jgi:16S rRNA (guanine1516-N2)-methyltransferase
MSPRLALVATAATDAAAAAALAQRLALPLFAHERAGELAADYPLLLLMDGPRLSLQQTGPRAPGPVAVDFGAGSMRHRRKGGQNELLGRAVGVGRKSPLTVLDATAGLGRDAFVLADLGCRVRLCEREPVVAALLEAGLACAAQQGDAWLGDTCARLQLWPADARSLPPGELGPVDVIYLDPMFPARGKSAAVKKEMALFQQVLEGDGGDPDEADSAQLLAWALAQPVARVVVKRPLKAPCLGGRAPSHQLKGKAVRFDVYVLRAFTAPSDGDPGCGTGDG